MQLQVEPRRRFQKHGRIWAAAAALATAIEQPRVQCIGGVAAGGFAAQGLAHGARILAPSAIAGLVCALDASALSPGSVSSWTDSIGGYIFDDQGVATRRPTCEADNWRAGTGIQSVLFDGVNDCLANETGLAEAVVDGTDKPYTFATAFQFVTVPTSYHVIFAFANQTTITQYVDFGKTTTGGNEVYRVGRADDVGGLGTTEVGTRVPDTNRHALVVMMRGTTIDILLDNTELLSLGGSSHAHNCSTVTVDRTSIGARFRGTSTIQGESNFRTPFTALYDNALSLANGRALCSWMMAKYKI